MTSLFQLPLFRYPWLDSLIWYFKLHKVCTLDDSINFPYLDFILENIFILREQGLKNEGCEEDNCWRARTLLFTLSLLGYNARLSLSIIYGLINILFSHCQTSCGDENSLIKVCLLLFFARLVLSWSTCC